MQLTWDRVRDIMTQKFVDKHVRLVKTEREIHELDQYVDRKYEKRVDAEGKGTSFVSTVLFLTNRRLDNLVSEMAANYDLFARNLGSKAELAAFNVALDRWNREVTQKAPSQPVPEYPRHPGAEAKAKVRFETRCVLPYRDRDAEETSPFRFGRLAYNVVLENNLFKINHLAGMMD